MGYARPLGQTVSVRHRNLANMHCVCLCVALIQIGILGEDFCLCRHLIRWLGKIQFVAARNPPDPIVDRADVANAFGTSQMGKRIGKQKRGVSAK
jgi:hypothetical protein